MGQPPRRLRGQAGRPCTRRSDLSDGCRHPSRRPCGTIIGRPSNDRPRARSRQRCAGSAGRSKGVEEVYVVGDRMPATDEWAVEVTLPMLGWSAARFGPWSDSCTDQPRDRGYPERDPAHLSSSREHAAPAVRGTRPAHRARLPCARPTPGIREAARPRTRRGARRRNQQGDPCPTMSSRSPPDLARAAPTG